MDCQRHLGGYFRAISNALGQNMAKDQAALGLTSTQAMFLHRIWYRQEILKTATYAKDLEDFFDIKHPTVSGILQRMEASGFIQLHLDEKDRRCKAIVLTAKAMEATAKTIEHINESEAALAAGMTEEEVAEFRRLLQKAADNLGVCTPRKKEVSNL